MWKPSLTTGTEADAMGVAFEVQRDVLDFIEELKDEAGGGGE